jgi:hypothetical protein
MPPPVARHDVPLALAAGALGVLLALFVPLSHVTPAYPTELAHLPADDAAVLRDHRAALALPAPPATREVLAAWDAWSAAAARGDAEAAHTTRETFAARLAAATGRVRAAQDALRARAAEAFLARLDAPRAPLTRVAARHGLTARSWYVTRAARVAWFALRWERNVAEPGDDGELEPIADTLLRVPVSYRRAFASWALDARCPELVGAAGRALTPDGARACGRFRADLIDLAAHLHPRYPREEARAAADMMLALGLRRAVAPAPDAPVTVVDDAARGPALADAQAALLRAEARYAAMLRATPTRRAERLYRGVTAALGDESLGP